MEKGSFDKRFLADRDETGRFIVVSKKTGVKYYVEPIDAEERSFWGDLDPATKKMTGSYGQKYKGSIRPEQSMITKDNGMEHITTLKPGESPLDYIERRDKEIEAGNE